MSVVKSVVVLAKLRQSQSMGAAAVNLVTPKLELRWVIVPVESITAKPEIPPP
jgi:hypothetical protein